MNPLPDAWRRLEATTVGGTTLVLVDTAMQHELGAALSADPGNALSLLVDTTEEARAMGVWLMDAQEAKARGIDGAGRGVSWLLSRRPLAGAASHLREWVVAPLPDGVERGYLRIGDGRVLRALLAVWTPDQRSAFFSPWYAWLYSDRDSQGCMVERELCEPSDAGPSVPKMLDPEQYAKLLKASVPDQLLHELKAYIRPHASFALREDRHRMAVAILEHASAIGYDDAEDQMTLMAWALRAGLEGCRYLGSQAAVRQHLRGEALWESLIDPPMSQSG